MTDGFTLMYKDLPGLQVLVRDLDKKGSNFLVGVGGGGGVGLSVTQ